MCTVAQESNRQFFAAHSELMWVSSESFRFKIEKIPQNPLAFKKRLCYDETERKAKEEF